MWSDLTDTNDEALLAESLVDPEAFAVLVRRYQEPFKRKARTVLWSEEDVEDVVQDTFLRIYTAAPRFRKVEGASVRAWGYRILMNTAFTRYAKRRRELGYMVELAPEEFEALGTDAAQEALEYELSEYVIRVLSSMPESMARVLRLQFLEDLSQLEIAERLGLSTAAVKARVHRAKAVFRAQSEHQGPF